MKLGRIPVLDPLSKMFPVRSLLAQEQLIPISKQWYVTNSLDQGQLSACVGFSWTHCLSAYPDPTLNLNANHAISLYKRAQRLDDLPGENYEGTSVLAGVKAVKRLFPGAIDSYHWAFGLQDLILALGYVGPVVLGINWYSSMYSPDIDGAIQVGGIVTGGHAILATGVDLLTKHITLKNSWGISWGIVGDCRINFDDMSRLLSETGEACVPTGKHTVNV